MQHIFLANTLKPRGEGLSHMLHDLIHLLYLDVWLGSGWRTGENSNNSITMSRNCSGHRTMKLEINYRKKETEKASGS